MSTIRLLGRVASLNGKVIRWGGGAGSWAESMVVTANAMDFRKADFIATSQSPRRLFCEHWGLANRFLLPALTRWRRRGPSDPPLDRSAGSEPGRQFGHFLLLRYRGRDSLSSRTSDTY